MSAIQGILNGIIKAGVSLATVATIAQTCFYVVDGGHRAVIFDRLEGVKDGSVGEGLHFIVPILQSPIYYETRTRYSNIRSETGSKDLQTIGITLRILYKPNPEKLSIIHKKLGPDYDERILPSLSNEVLKSVVAQYDAGELITQREVVSKQVREALNKRAVEFNIMLEDVDTTFSPEFTSAIESKQVAQQEAERSKFLVAKAEQEKKAAVIRAEGEAEAAKLIEEAMKGSNGFIELRRIEAARDIAETLSRSKNILYMPKGANILMNMSPPARDVSSK